MGVKGKSTLGRHYLIPLCDLDPGFTLPEPLCRERSRLNVLFVSTGNSGCWVGWMEGQASPQGPGTLSASLGPMKGCGKGCTMPRHHTSQKRPLIKLSFMCRDLFYLSQPYLQTRKLRFRGGLCLVTHAVTDGARVPPRAVCLQRPP